METNDAPADTLFVGDWTRALLCRWSGYDVVVNPYERATQGVVVVYVYSSVDVAFLQPQAFAHST